MPRETKSFQCFSRHENNNSLLNIEFYLGNLFDSKTHLYEQLLAIKILNQLLRKYTTHNKNTK